MSPEGYAALVCGLGSIGMFLPGLIDRLRGRTHP